MQDVRRQLFGEHEQIEFSIQYLARAARAGASGAALGECWARFEVSLLEHLAAEERHLFVIVEGAHRAGIEALRAEHAQIRQALLELAPSADRGEMNPRKLDSLHKLLSAHAAHESYSLYQWLEEGNRAGLHGSVSKVVEARAAASAERDRSITVPAIPARMRAHLG